LLKSKRLLVWFFSLTAGLFICFGPAAETSDQITVVVIEISGTIDPGTNSYVKHAFEEAEREGAAAVILQLDTPGGFISSAESIRRLMDEFTSPVYAFVSPKALSAGAYLALAADEIYMVPGSTIGAAEPRLLGVGEVDEKELSAWEKEMAGMAERQDRDPQIASAMVRRDIVIDDLVEEGILLTLTAGEALEVGYSEATVSSLEAVLQETDLEDARVVSVETRATDTLVSWTTNPVVGTLLILIGLGGLILEVLSAGFGVAGLVSLTAFALYFGGNIAAGMAEYWVLILFVFGIAMLLVEAFIPGLGIFGATGLISTLAAIVLAAVSIQTGLIMLVIALVLSVAFSVFAFRYFAGRGALRHIILSAEEKADQGYVAPRDQSKLTGKEGIAITSLRPSGTAEIEGKRVDVVSEGSYVPAGEKLVVERVEGVRVIVRPLK